VNDIFNLVTLFIIYNTLLSIQTHKVSMFCQNHFLDVPVVATGIVTGNDDLKKD